MKHAVGLALLAELEEKAGASRKRGRTPHPSRYRATALALSYLAAAAQDYKTVGLTRTKKAMDLESYLRHSQATRGSAIDVLAEPEVAPAPDRAAVATGRDDARTLTNESTEGGE
jgi:hypothetical protein